MIQIKGSTTYPVGFWDSFSVIESCYKSFKYCELNSPEVNEGLRVIRSILYFLKAGGVIKRYSVICSAFNNYGDSPVLILDISITYLEEDYTDKTSIRFACSPRFSFFQRLIKFFRRLL